jgi:RecB family exonuclease
VGLLDGDPLTASEQLARTSDGHLASRRLARRVTALRARLDPAPTEFDGMVGPHPELDPPDKVWSITALEKQAGCGLEYFGVAVLGVSDETDAAMILSIEPAERGILVHAVFERLAGEWLDLAPDQRPAWLQGEHLAITQQRAIAVLDELAAEIAGQNRLGHESAWGAERVHILRSIKATLDDESAEGSIPVAGEHVFTGVMVSGATFGGKIDRIDLLPDGGLRVTDFKTGKAVPLTNPLDDGHRLQLPLYARAADRDRAILVGDEADGSPPATARYLHVRDAAAVAKLLELTPDVITEFEGYVRRWLDEIAAGHFSPRPHPPGGRCVMCCVDSLGLEELAERARLFGDHAVADNEGVQP